MLPTVTLPNASGPVVETLIVGGGTVQTLPASDDPEVAEAALRSLHALVDDRRIRELVITKVDGAPVGESPLRERLVGAGFSAGYRGLVLRPGR